MSAGFRFCRLFLVAVLLSACGETVAPEPDIQILSPFEALEVGGTMQLAVTLAGSGGEPVPSDQVEWSSSSPSIVEVFEDGGIVARRIGRANITATVGELSAVVQITVIPTYVLRVLHISSIDVHPTGLNNSGHVVAWVDSLSNDALSKVSFVWTPEARFPLGEGEALDISDSGDVVGTFDSEAVLWSGSQRLTVFSRPGGEARATALSSAGTIAGYWRPTESGCEQCPHDILRGMVGSMSVVLPDLLEGRVRGMNGSGWLVGTFAKAGRPGDLFPFVYREGEFVELPPQDEPGIASDIDHLGTIVGTGNGDIRIWRQADLVEMEPSPQTGCGAMAEGINDQGEIVGSLDCEATLWRDGRPINLQELHGFTNWTVTRAIRINSNGQILGYAVSDNATLKAVVLLDPLR